MWRAQLLGGPERSGDRTQFGSAAPCVSFNQSSAPCNLVISLIVMKPRFAAAPRAVFVRAQLLGGPERSGDRTQFGSAAPCVSFNQSSAPCNLVISLIVMKPRLLQLLALSSCVPSSWAGQNVLVIEPVRGCGNVCKLCPVKHGWRLVMFDDFYMKRGCCSSSRCLRACPAVGRARTFWWSKPVRGCGSVGELCTVKHASRYGGLADIATGQARLKLFVYWQGRKRSGDRPQSGGCWCVRTFCGNGRANFEI
jgi:hypothetical protein